MSKQLIECVPNFSEGNDMKIINKITDEIISVEGVSLLDVDPGKATNRTVVTFVGTPDEVSEAAFLCIKKAYELIDMSKHKGKHPRMGATDVCPFVPVANISMEETVKYARKLAKRVGEELEIPIYCYEEAALEKERKNLAYCRSGEYEKLSEKLADIKMKPDFGSSEYNEKVEKSGATAIGARNFLVAYNINLNTTSTRRANAVAFDLREAGRIKRENDSILCKIIRDENGKALRTPGILKKTKAIGWFIEEYGITQISINLTDIKVTPVHIAFDAACKKAQERGIRVTGSELVGLIPLKAMMDAGKYFLQKQKRSLGISESEIIKIAVKSLGLDELKEFKPEEKIIEYILNKDKKNPLISMNLEEFVNETASESAAPGGGSISAYIGSLGVALGTMVANLASHKRGWDDKWEFYSKWAENGQFYKNELLKMVDEDTNAFNKIMDAFSLSKNTDEEKNVRNNEIQKATKYAIEIPFKVMKLSYEAMEMIKVMAEMGNPNSVSDAGVGALAMRSAVMGAFLNVKINSSHLNDKNFINKILKEGKIIEEKTINLEKEILEIVNSKI